MKDRNGDRRDGGGGGTWGSGGGWGGEGWVSGGGGGGGDVLSVETSHSWKTLKLFSLPPWTESV